MLEFVIVPHVSPHDEGSCNLQFLMATFNNSNINLINIKCRE